MLKAVEVRTLLSGLLATTGDVREGVGTLKAMTSFLGGIRPHPARRVLLRGSLIGRQGLYLAGKSPPSRGSLVNATASPI